MVSDEIQRYKARMDGLVREQADRRAMLDRQGQEIQARSQEYMTKQVQAAERYVQHRRELGRREREAGGWGTEKALADKNTTMRFGPAEDEEDPYAAARSTESLTPRPPQPAEPSQEPAPRRARHSRADFDEDDFSNNSWLG
ncbi:hypothetical protein FHX82_000914 [Amycolatopsis bartoniae]|uniref:Uncharacterized protein n=1 Tax=Amycolatopsis bartoniae TaxID=941986 RepID=A0A8H9J2L4_9PSEU|nr:hypothetical protein [Amycolatopsis bartoniae]MBB2933894.1 hypothetical protein [Amycolatopsis bartoniae]TVS99249.1 hypothetical protein FNH07_35400 [Amycolatopsis bartoniae]GHF88307.1 hypothetical protein GCM10017566_72610 [Amycolatopsis bartoniae]